jgi:two-component system, NarL family, invasion response regulator UvrY
MIRILIADDHAILRRGLRGILEREFDASVFGEAENARQVLEALDREHWDLVILDISLPGRSGLDALRDLRTRRPELPVLVLSMYAEEQYGKRVLKAGAAGYMTKETAPSELVAAVHQVLKGGHYLSATLAEQLAIDLQRDSAELPHEALSQREFEVLRLIGSGQSVTQIADLLCLSDKTVSTYRARILEKMRMKTTADLIRYTVDQHLIQ